MIRRVPLLALAALAVLPAVASAQLITIEERPWTAQFRVTPFAAWMTSFTRTETWSNPDGQLYTQLTPDFEVGAGGALGLNVDVPLTRRFGLTALGAWGRRGETLYDIEELSDPFRVDGSNVILGRLGLAVHLHEPISELMLRRLGASVWAGGAMMHERPRNTLGTAEFLGNRTHWGINVGFAGDLPIGDDRFSIQASLEDNILWYRSPTGLANELLGPAPGSEGATRTGNDPVHAWMIRLGFGIRLQ